MPRTFLPWARPNLKELRQETKDSSLDASAMATVRITVNESAPISKKMVLDGPGDVIGIDFAQVRRTDPAPGTLNFEPNYFPMVEFARPDFPWLYTPATANDQNQLRPWIVLAAVRKQPGVSLLRPEGHLPVLEIGDPVRPADELPDLVESWAWAHAQVEGSMPADGLGSLLASAPHLVCSRLLFPRPLKASAGYYACVVPAFEAGRLAGLSDGPTIAKLEPAWTKASKSVRLPVYYMWEFATGPGGDFESLVQLLLEGQAVPAGRPEPRIVDASEAGSNLPKPASVKHQSSFPLECPLVPIVRPVPADAPPQWEGKFADALSSALRAAIAPAAKRGDPQLTPPVYGGGYVSEKASRFEGDAPPPWLRDLNLDPRYRVAAAFGAEVVRRHQDRLVDSAWDQAGAIREANRLIIQSQAAAVASQAMIRRHLAHIPDERIIEFTQSLHGSLQIDGESFRGMVAEARIARLSPAVPVATPAAGVTTAEFSRFTRARGPMVRRVAAPVARRGRAFFDDVAGARLLLDAVRHVPETATPESVEQLFAGRRTDGTKPMSFGLINTVQTSPPPPSFSITSPSLPLPPGEPGVLGSGMIFAVAGMPGATNEVGKRFGEALGAHQSKLTSANAPAAPTPPLRDLVALLRLNLAPMQLFQRALADRVQIAGQPTAPAADAPSRDAIIATQHTAPTFQEPLYAALGAISPALVVQGFEAIGNNTITPLETNVRFVEAFMAGANHEMARELVWREFPLTDHATLFRTFWDSSALTPQDDIEPIQEWTTGHLGTHSRTGPRAVFLLRGELIRRYPTVIVYLQQSQGDDSEGRPMMGTERRQPTIRGSVSSDAAFYGFEIDKGELTDGTGWIFVIEEPVTEPRFGFEVNPDGAAPEISPAADAAKTARQRRQNPVRFAIHARDLLVTHG